jgi:hypothetical protein
MQVQSMSAPNFLEIFVNQSVPWFYSLGMCRKCIGALTLCLHLNISYISVYRSLTEGLARLLQKLIISCESPYMIIAGGLLSSD